MPWHNAAYGLCSGLSEHTILGYFHKHLNYRDLPRVEIQLSSLSCQKFGVIGQDDVWTYLLLTGILQLQSAGTKLTPPLILVCQKC